MSFEATHPNGSFWKKVVECLKDLVPACNFEITQNGINLQAVDTSHVALVSLSLGNAGFAQYSCHSSSEIIGINLSNFAKLLKVAGDSDQLTLRKEQDTDVLEIESLSKDARKVTTFQMKLMEIEGDNMGVPDDDLDYKSFISMPADMFGKLCKDMQTFDENMSFEVTKDELTCRANGDMGEGCIKIRSAGRCERAHGAAPPPAVKDENAVKAEVKSEVKKEPENQEEQQEQPEQQENQEQPEQKEETNPKSKGAKGAKAPAEETNDGVYITSEEDMSLTFALRYLVIFSKGAALSNRVRLSLSNTSPCRIEFDLGNMGHLRWFLAPKVDDDNTQQ